jgi:hypothetical protein
MIAEMFLLWNGHTIRTDGVCYKGLAYFRGSNGPIRCSVSLDMLINYFIIAYNQGGDMIRKTYVRFCLMLILMLTAAAFAAERVVVCEELYQEG